MYVLVPTKSFKKGIKRYKHDAKALEFIQIVLRLLQQGAKLPQKYKEHVLQGKWNTYLECHIRPDLLLIYSRDKKSKKVFLHDIGSHSYLFG